MSKRLLRVSQLAREYNFTEAQIRWWAFNSATNGLDDLKAIIRIGRTVHFDADRFEQWLDSHAGKQS